MSVHPQTPAPILRAYTQGSVLSCISQWGTSEDRLSRGGADKIGAREGCPSNLDLHTHFTPPSLMFGDLRKYRVRGVVHDLD